MLTDTEIKREGFKILVEKLGNVDADTNMLIKNHKLL
jgi:hypothetical protein